MMRLPLKMPGLPSYRVSVDAAAAAENLKAVAAATDDPEILLGLAFFAKAGDPVRLALAQMAVTARNEYHPVVAVLSLTMDGIDEVSVGELVRLDPDNALGHYLQGTLFHVADREPEALAAFRKAAACATLRCHDSIIGGALLKALDALGLQGLDRLCAMSWTVSRWTNFSGAGIQPIYGALSELARSADPATRSELAETLLGLAGHLFATNFTNRWFARMAVQHAFGLKAELAAAHVPVMNGYAAAIQGLNNTLLPSAGGGNPMTANWLHLAQFLPSRIHRAFAATDPWMMNGRFLGELNLNPPASDQATFEAAKEHATQAASKLLETALSDPDGILGAYLKGLPAAPAGQNPPWASFGTPVGSLMERRPDLFRAAVANEEAMNGLIQTGQSDPAARNIGRLMEIARAVQGYAQKHDLAYPASLAPLYESGALNPAVAPESLLTGRPFVYVAAGEKRPAKLNDQAVFVLLYDDEPNQHGCHPCAFASGVGGHLPPPDLQEQLRRRGK